MSVYRDFKQRTEELRSDAARFRSVVLHMHSPESHDQERGRPERARAAFQQALRDSSLDLVAITDHMKCRLACELSNTAASSPCILPGMEVNLVPPAPWSMYRLHLLIVFPEGHRVEQITPCLPAGVVEVPDKKRTGQEKVQGESIKDFIEDVHDCSGICVAAHVDTEAGIRATFRQLGEDAIGLLRPVSDSDRVSVSKDFKPWLLGAGFDGIEVSKFEDKTHYRWRHHESGREVTVPVLLTNDAHTAEDLMRPERITHIKMTEVSFSGLKKALAFPETRLRFPEELPEDVIPRIEGMQIASTEDGGFFQNLELGFSDNLTCLIGPRGAGKSAIVEALRYVFGYNQTLDELEEDGGVPQKVRSLQKATLHDSVIRILYRTRSNELHVLEATFSEDAAYGTHVYGVDGSDRAVPRVEDSGEYPLRLFGWSELELLGRDPQRQRELLDKLIPGLKADLNRRHELRQDLKQKRREVEDTCEQLQRVLELDHGAIERYQELKQRFERLNTEEVKELFEQVDSIRQKKKIIDNQLDIFRNWLRCLYKARVSQTDTIIREPDEASDEDLVQWWQERIEEWEIPSAIADLRASVRTAVKEFGSRIVPLIEKRKALDTYQGRYLDEIRTEVAEDPGETVTAQHREEAATRLRSVQEVREQYTDTWTLLCDAIDAWWGTAETLCNCQQAISAKRSERKGELEEKLNEFSEGNLRITLSFETSGDRSLFREELADGEILSREQHGQYRASDYPSQIAGSFTPLAFAGWLLGSFHRDFGPGHFWRRQCCPTDDLQNKVAERIRASFSLCTYNEGARVPVPDKQTVSKVLRVAEIPWDDKETIHLNGTPIHKVSPGQRSSAMLPLILLTEDVPLVIDQPEDNLDNKLIGLTLVDILARLKEQRQIIVATHNPNIVVLGDAEQVVVLEPESAERGRVEEQASVDSPDIVKAIIDIMEGGEEAFQKRNTRYGL